MRYTVEGSSLAVKGPFTLGQLRHMWHSGMFTADNRLVEHRPPVIRTSDDGESTFGLLGISTGETPMGNVFSGDDLVTLMEPKQQPHPTRNEITVRELRESTAYRVVRRRADALWVVGWLFLVLGVISGFFIGPVAIFIGVLNFFAWAATSAVLELLADIGDMQRVRAVVMPCKE